jgi:hypothetical protein
LRCEASARAACSLSGIAYRLECGRSARLTAPKARLMSHYTRIRTRLQDAALLAAALKEVGYSAAEVHDEPQPLYGYRGDVRPESAEVIVRRKHVGSASNDIGFARQADGCFEAVISDYDRHRHDERWLALLTQAYGHAAALQYARDHSYDVLTDQSDRDGTRRLTLRRLV